MKTKGGYELRSGKGFTFKGCSGKKAITLIPSAKDRLYIFESMFDYLSYIVLHSRVIKKRIVFLDGEVIILNSTSIVKRIIPYLKQRQFSEILTFFDKDKAGEKGLALLQEQFKVEPQIFYSGFKDVNEFLVYHSSTKPGLNVFSGHANYVLHPSIQPTTQAPTIAAPGVALEVKRGHTGKKYAQTLALS